MANTYTSLHYHVIFSTKNREPWITPEIEARVWRFIGGIARKHAMTALQIGGVENHLHALLTGPPILAPSQIAQILKGESSKWIHSEFQLKGFSWQDGYGAFYGQHLEYSPGYFLHPKSARTSSAQDISRRIPGVFTGERHRIR